MGNMIVDPVSRQTLIFPPRPDLALLECIAHKEMLSSMGIPGYFLT
jgi:hypothetical protein